VGPFGISEFLFSTGKNISKWDTGIVTSYALYIVLGLIAMLFILFAPIIFYGNILAYNPDITIVNYFRLLFIYIPTILFIIVT
jgi:NADH-ubiquinone oxidoreductase chain 5